MRLVHFSDTHLGFVAFNRLDDRGHNMRERDVAGTFHQLIDQVIALKPDVIVVGGDVFHAMRPRNHVVIETFAELGRLVAALPGVPIVVCAGNHDCPRSADASSILPLYERLGIHVADDRARTFEFPGIGLSVLAVPDVFNLVRPKFTPNPAFRFNVIVMHGEVEGMTDYRMAPERAAVEIAVDDIQPTSWDYVALGHYHVHRILAPNMAYSGSIDYTSTDPWGELREERATGVNGKGFVERNLSTGEHTFHPLPASRDFLDLTLSADGLSAADLDAQLRDLVDEEYIDGAVVRVRLTECPREISRALNTEPIRRWKRRAVNFHLSVHPPEITRVGTIPTRSPGGRLPTIPEMLEAIFRRRAEEGLTGDLTYEQLSRLSEKYLTAADEKLNPSSIDAAPRATEEMIPAEVAS